MRWILSYIAFLRTIGPFQQKEQMGNTALKITEVQVCRVKVKTLKVSS